MKNFILGLLVAVLFWAAGSVGRATTLDGQKYGIGFQAARPLVGLSATMDLADTPASFQLLVGWEHIPSVSTRIRYAFLQQPHYDIYGYGMIGITSKAEINLFAGAGFGIELDWRRYDKSLPPISWSIEAGHNFNDFTLGVGVHYTF